MTVRKKKNGSKPVAALTVAELERMSAEFDGEFVADTFAVPSPNAKERLRRAKRTRGRPRVGTQSGERRAAYASGEHQVLDPGLAEFLHEGSRRTQADPGVGYAVDGRRVRLVLEGGDKELASGRAAGLDETDRQRAAAGQYSKFTRHHPIEVGRWNAKNRRE